MTAGVRGWAVAAALALACGGCGHRPASEGAPPIDTSILRDVGTIEGDFMARQRLSGAMGEHALAGDVVLQKQGSTLTLLGLTPFGTRAFAVIQEGRALRVEAPPGAPLPFPPELMLVDVHRALFVGVGEGALADGVHRRRLGGGEVVVETWSKGKLLRRVFEKRRGRPRGPITIEYGEGLSEGAPPREIAIDNARLGYRVTIETVSFQRLGG